ncbi:MAG: RluA family pseudouridine synthase [Simkaniaceae bacterium]
MNNKHHQFLIEEKEENMRLDLILARRFPEYSRSYFHYLFENKTILLNGSIALKRSKPHIGDIVSLHFLDLPAISLKPQNIPLEILHEDAYFLAVNKPADMVVHPAPGNPDSTFVNALLFYLQDAFKDSDASLRPGIVHRLDKETSGVLLAAKTPAAHEAFVHLFAERKVEKTYLAVCLGHPGNVCIQQPIGRHPMKRKEMAVTSKGKPAVTKCMTISTNKNFSYVKLLPLTGRTHQIRVHLKHIGNPILGDKIYGNSSLNIKHKIPRQLLHAYHLKFIHPFKNKEIRIEAPIPEDLQTWINKI